MLEIIARNDDGFKLEFEFRNAEDFIEDMNNNKDCMSDHEILFVKLGNDVLYCSLGNNAKNYDETLRTMDVYDWFV